MDSSFIFCLDLLWTAVLNSGNGWALLISSSRQPVGTRGSWHCTYLSAFPLFWVEGIVTDFPHCGAMPGWVRITLRYGPPVANSKSVLYLVQTESSAGNAFCFCNSCSDLIPGPKFAHFLESMVGLQRTTLIRCAGKGCWLNVSFLSGLVTC